ncbi:hypothetical protein WLU67_24330, partial [Bordetella bronchiseptica]
VRVRPTEHGEGLQVMVYTRDAPDLFLGCSGPNQMKAFLRCGMGPCQGRLCGLTVSELIADERGVPLPEVGYYRLRFPTKPVTLGELASLPQTEASRQAVVRLKKTA